MGVFEMTDKMKLGLVFGVIVVAFIAQIIIGTPVEVEASSNIVADDLRLRVIAHSDDSFDQVVKRVVVFAVEEFMNRHEFGYTVDFLVGNLEEIHAVVADVLTEIDVEIDIEVSFGYHYFPVSNGYYASLVVRLGDATGDNWWCFINPGVCIVPNDEYVSVNAVQIEVREQVQQNLGQRTFNFIGGLLGGIQNQELASGEIDWFLFDDER